MWALVRCLTNEMQRRGRNPPDDNQRRDAKLWKRCAASQSANERPDRSRAGPPSLALSSYIYSGVEWFDTDGRAYISVRPSAGECARAYRDTINDGRLATRVEDAQRDDADALRDSLARRQPAGDLWAL